MLGRIKESTVNLKRVLFFALLSSFALLAELNIPAGIEETRFPVLVNLTGSFDTFSFERCMVVVGTFLFFYCCDRYLSKDERSKWTVIVQSVLFALFIVFGYSFWALNSWNLVMSLKYGQPLKVLVVLSGYYCLFSTTLTVAYQELEKWLSTYDEQQHTNRGVDKTGIINCYIAVMDRYTFRTMFITLLILYIPCTLVSYPAVFMGDTAPQIRQAFSELGMAMGYMRSDQLLAEGVYINQHHPVAHTMLIHLCLVIGGKIFNSFNVGIFIYGLIQELFLIAVLSYATAAVSKKMRLSKACIFTFIAYIAIHPQIHRLLFLVTKDIIYTGFYILLLVKMFEMLCDGNKRTLAGLLVACAGMVLFRNDSKYLLVAAFILVAIINKKFRGTAATCAIMVVVFSIIMSATYTSLNYTPGSTREMFSVPFQQTARYVRYHSDEVTSEERKAINRILDYDSIGRRYEPSNADPVKETYKEEATKEDLANYFKVWGQMLVKHPGSYVQATMNNYYQYFYPEHVTFRGYGYAWSEEKMKDINEQIQPLGYSFNYPGITKVLRDAADAMYEGTKTFPGMNLLMTSGIYSWVVIAIVAMGIRLKNRNILTLMGVPVMMFFICILGPCNGGYGRYVYPIVVSLPVLIPMLVYLERNKRIN